MCSSSHPPLLSLLLLSHSSLLAFVAPGLGGDKTISYVIEINLETKTMLRQEIITVLSYILIRQGRRLGGRRLYSGGGDGKAGLCHMLVHFVSEFSLGVFSRISSLGLATSGSTAGVALALVSTFAFALRLYQIER